MLFFVKGLGLGRRTSSSSWVLFDGGNLFALTTYPWFLGRLHQYTGLHSLGMRGLSMSRLPFKEGMLFKTTLATYLYWEATISNHNSRNNKDSRTWIGYQFPIFTRSMEKIDEQ